MALSRRATVARLSVLLTALLLVSLWAWQDVNSRRERNTWRRPLSIAVVLVLQGPVDPGAIADFRDRLLALDDRLTEERRKYGAGAPHPFSFWFAGPAGIGSRPPTASGDGLFDAVVETYARWRWTSRVDGAAGVDRSLYDSRIYVAARPPASDQTQMVEGESEEGGRVGIVEVELNASMVDFALFVVAHELMHTMGATDKYDSQGNTLIPAGLADPTRRPLFPQPCAEVMARNRPVDQGVEEPPTDLQDLCVGPTTAREIGWLR